MQGILIMVPLETFAGWYMARTGKRLFVGDVPELALYDFVSEEIQVKDAWYQNGWLCAKLLVPTDEERIWTHYSDGQLLANGTVEIG